MQRKKEQGGRTTAIRDDLIVWGERCARADFAAVGCDDSSDGAYSNWGLRGGGILISLSWYCDCATGELTEAEPEEAEGDDILVCC